MSRSPEWAFLLASAKTSLTGEDSRRVEQELVHPSLDWAYMGERACQHGIASLVYHNLRRMAGPGMPLQEVLDALKEEYYRTAMRNTLLYRELREVLNTLKEKGIEVIILKGAALAEIVYHNRTLRPMGDIDLLIRKEELAGVEDWLSRLGYCLYKSRNEKELLAEHHYHWVFTKREATPIEIHWNLRHAEGPLRIDVDGLWKRAVPATVAEVETLVLCPEDLLLHLCLHTCRHQLAWLRPFCDIAETVREFGEVIDWEQVRTRAFQWRINKYVYLTLRLTKELLGAGVPESVLESLKPADCDARLLDRAREGILADKDLSPLSPNFQQLWCGRRFTEKVAAVRQLLAPQVIARKYGIHPTAKTVYGYYPVHLTDLLIRYGPVLWRSTWRGRQKPGMADGQSQLTEWLASGQ
jgi:hypothetical protein